MGKHFTRTRMHFSVTGFTESVYFSTQKYECSCMGFCGECNPNFVVKKKKKKSNHQVNEMDYMGFMVFIY